MEGSFTPPSSKKERPQLTMWLCVLPWCLPVLASGSLLPSTLDLRWDGSALLIAEAMVAGMCENWTDV